MEDSVVNGDGSLPGNGSGQGLVSNSDYGILNGRVRKFVFEKGFSIGKGKGAGWSFGYGHQFHSFSGRTSYYGAPDSPLSGCWIQK